MVSRKIEFRWRSSDMKKLLMGAVAALLLLGVSFAAQ
jgi:hypothetical protein